MHKIIRALGFTLALCGLSGAHILYAEAPDVPYQPVELVAIEPIRVYAAEPVTEVYLGATDEEIDLIALITMAEAEGEPERGKRLVIDTILNRVDSEYFPDTITDVIYQKNAFEALWNGRVDKCYVMDDIRELVVEELQQRSNYDVVFFTAGHYGIYGEPLFQVGNHYFASYD